MTAKENDGATVDRLLGLADQCLEDWREDANDGGDPHDTDLIERETEWEHWRPRIVACVNACQGVADPATLIAAVRRFMHDGADLQSLIDAGNACGLERAP